MGRDPRRTRRRATALCALVFVGLAGSCGGGGPDTIALDGDPLRGTVETVDGGQLELDEFADADLVVWFWAPW
jgi:hypothetical protein